MSKALNLSLLANNVNSSGELDGGAVNGSVASADAASQVVTTNFSILEEGGKLVIKYGSTVIVSIDSTGAVTAIDNVTAYGAP